MSTPTYRYEVAGLLSDKTFDELPLPAVTFDTRLSNPGTFSLASPLNVASAALGRRLQLVAAGATAIYAYRNDALWWGGIVWTTTPAGDNKGNPTWTMQASTWDSYVARVNAQTDLIVTADDPLNQARTVLAAMQADPYANLNLVPDATVSGVAGAAFTLLASGNSSYGAEINQLATQAPGFDYAATTTVNSGTSTRVRRLRLGYPTLAGSTVHQFTRPGNIVTYSTPADATVGGTEARAFGATTNSNLAGTSQPAVSSTYLAAAQLAAGYPRLDIGNTYSSVSDPGTLNAHAQADLAAGATPVRIPALTVRLDHTDITPDSLGDQALIKITDPMFPDGMTVSARIIGIQIQTQDRTGAELATLTFN